MTKGIIFKQWEVKAALEDAKSQKRVPVKPQPDHLHTFEPGVLLPQFGDDEIKSPHQVGDLVFVKETWCKPLYGDMKGEPYYKTSVKSHSVIYKADCGKEIHGMGCNYWMQESDFHWRSAYHMRQEYARLWYEITGVRVERVRDISEEDAEAEGALMDDQLRKLYKGICPNAACGVDFMDLWGFDHPKYPFDTSWCWVFDLKKAEAPDV